jgi:hypothetical protein
MRRLLVVLVGVLLLAPSTVLAREATPSAAAPLASLLPGQEVFGKQWISLPYTPYAADETYFTDGIGTFYGGTSGARVTISLFRNETARSSITQAWDLLATWIAADTYNDAYDVEYTSQDDLSHEALPPGIDDAMRIEGTDSFMWLPFCAGAYAIDPDVMFYVRAQGRITLTTGPNDGMNDCDDIAAFIANRYRG